MDEDRLTNKKLFIRFIIVGLSNVLITLLFFQIIFSLHIWDGVNAAMSQAIAYTISVIWSFFWHRNLTFKSRGKIKKEFWKFALTNCAYLIISSGLIGLGIDYFKMPKTLVWIIVVGTLSITSFMLYRFWIFYFEKGPYYSTKG
jgi:putative flippase GtrA